MNTEEETGTLEIEENSNQNNTPKVEGMGEEGKTPIPWKKILTIVGIISLWILKAAWYLFKGIFKFIVWFFKNMPRVKAFPD